MEIKLEKVKHFRFLVPLFHASQWQVSLYKDQGTKEYVLRSGMSRDHFWSIQPNIVRPIQPNLVQKVQIE